MKNLPSKKGLHQQIHILERRRGWLAVDKPWGVSVHNDPGKDLVSLVHDMISSQAGLAARLGTGSAFRVQPVHRLDKETSGVILLAVDDDMLSSLSALFSGHQVKKRYIAVVHGHPNAAQTKSGNNVWDHPLSKGAAGRTNPAGSGKRVSCRTRFTVLQQSMHYSLLDITLETGRKHQIRRHAKLSGHPVTGDTRYGSKRAIRFLKEKCNFHRLGLHCKSLEFVPPGQTLPVCITSKNSLTEMKQLLAGDT